MKAHQRQAEDLKISACVIVKNEENNLAKSINSYKKYVDEIIVVDTGSTDKTVETAQNLGAKVLSFSWCDDFSAARNTALDAAAGDWVLFLDADDYFANGTGQNLRAAVSTADALGKNAIGCRVGQIDTGTGELLSEGFSVKAFKAGARYKYPIHEEIRTKDGLTVFYADKALLCLEHTGYSGKCAGQKIGRNLRMLLNDLKTQQETTRIISDYLYLSDAYYGAGQFKKSRVYAKKYIKNAKGHNLRIIGCETNPYYNIITSLEIEGADAARIRPYARAFKRAYPDSADAAYAMGRNSFCEFMFVEAIDEFKKALSLSENEKTVYLERMICEKDKIYNYIGACKEGLLNTAEAMDAYFAALCNNGGNFIAAYNLFRIVKGMPQDKVDAFAEPLYLAAPQKKHGALLSALMCNYMTEQAVKCYAAYRAKFGGDKIDPYFAAFVMAGQGKYDEAAAVYLVKKCADSNARMRCLLYADISGEKMIKAKALEAAAPAHAFALGYAQKPEGNAVVRDMAAVYSEACRLGKTAYAVEKILYAAEFLDSVELLHLCYYLAGDMAFEAALCAAQQADISAESVFMQAYCLYRMHRLNEAAELLLLSKHMGCKTHAQDAIYESIAAAKAKSEDADCKKQAAALRVRIGQKIAANDIDGAQSDIEIYLRIAEPDAEVFTAESVLLYYKGEYKRAALAAECGLLKDENNFDLLYNAGCIYEKLQKPDTAKSMYQKALENCTGKKAADELKSLIEAS